MTIKKKITKKVTKKKVNKRKNPDSATFQSAVNKKVVLTLKYNDSNVVIFGTLKEYMKYDARNYDFLVDIEGDGGQVYILSENMRINKTTIGSNWDTSAKYHISNNNDPSLWDY